MRPIPCAITAILLGLSAFLLGIPSPYENTLRGSGVNRTAVLDMGNETIPMEHSSGDMAARKSLLRGRGGSSSSKKQRLSPHKYFAPLSSSDLLPSSRGRLLDEGEPCVLNSQGTFGKVESEKLHYVSFFYQAIFAPGTSALEVAAELLPLLEEEITTGILPILFDCPTDTPTSFIAGVSKRLDDTVTASVPCFQVVQGECYSFQGRMLFFSNDIAGPSDAQFVGAEIVKNFLLTDRLAEVDSRILDVSYVFRDGGVWVLSSIPPSPTPTFSPTSSPTHSPSLAPSAASEAPSEYPTISQKPTTENATASDGPRTFSTPDDDDDRGPWRGLFIVSLLLLICGCAAACYCCFRDNRTYNEFFARRKDKLDNPYGDSADTKGIDEDDQKHQDEYLPPGLGTNSTSFRRGSMTSHSPLADTAPQDAGDTDDDNTPVMGTTSLSSSLDSGEGENEQSENSPLLESMPQIDHSAPLQDEESYVDPNENSLEQELAEYEDDDDDLRSDPQPEILQNDSMSTISDPSKNAESGDLVDSPNGQQRPQNMHESWSSKLMVHTESHEQHAPSYTEEDPQLQAYRDEEEEEAEELVETAVDFLHEKGDQEDANETSDTSSENEESQEDEDGDFSRADSNQDDDEYSSPEDEAGMDDSSPEDQNTYGEEGEDYGDSFSSAGNDQLDQDNFENEDDSYGDESSSPPADFQESYGIASVRDHDNATYGEDEDTYGEETYASSVPHTDFVESNESGSDVGHEIYEDSDGDDSPVGSYNVESMNFEGNGDYQSGQQESLEDASSSEEFDEYTAEEETVEELMDGVDQSVINRAHLDQSDADDTEDTTIADDSVEHGFARSLSEHHGSALGNEPNSEHDEPFQSSWESPQDDFSSKSSRVSGSVEEESTSKSALSEADSQPFHSSSAPQDDKQGVELIEEPSLSSFGDQISKSSSSKRSEKEPQNPEIARQDRSKHRSQSPLDDQVSRSFDSKRAEDRSSFAESKNQSSKETSSRSSFRDDISKSSNSKRSRSARQHSDASQSSSKGSQIGRRLSNLSTTGSNRDSTLTELETDFGTASESQNHFAVESLLLNHLQPFGRQDPAGQRYEDHKKKADPESSLGEGLRIYVESESDDEESEGCVIPIESDDDLSDHDANIIFHGNDTKDTYVPPGLGTSKVDDIIGQCRVSAIMAMPPPHAAHLTPVIEESGSVSSASTTEPKISRSEKRNRYPNNKSRTSVLYDSDDSSTRSGSSHGRTAIRSLKDELEGLKSELSKIHSMNRELAILRQERDSYEKQMWNMRQTLRGKPDEEELKRLKRERDIFENQVWKLRQTVEQSEVERRNASNETPDPVLHLLEENQSLMMHILSMNEKRGDITTQEPFARNLRGSRPSKRAQLQQQLRKSHAAAQSSSQPFVQDAEQQKAAVVDELVGIFERDPNHGKLLQISSSSAGPSRNESAQDRISAVRELVSPREAGAPKVLHQEDDNEGTGSHDDSSYEEETIYSQEEGVVAIPHYEEEDTSMFEEDELDFPNNRSDDSLSYEEEPLLETIEEETEHDLKDEASDSDHEIVSQVLVPESPAVVAERDSSESSSALSSKASMINHQARDIRGDEGGFRSESPESIQGASDGKLKIQESQSPKISRSTSRDSHIADSPGSQASSAFDGIGDDEGLLEVGVEKGSNSSLPFDAGDDMDVPGHRTVSKSIHAIQAPAIDTDHVDDSETQRISHVTSKAKDDDYVGFSESEDMETVEIQQKAPVVHHHDSPLPSTRSVGFSIGVLPASNERPHRRNSTSMLDLKVVSTANELAGLPTDIDVPPSPSSGKFGRRHSVDNSGPSLDQEMLRGDGGSLFSLGASWMAAELDASEIAEQYGLEPTTDNESTTLKTQTLAEQLLVDKDTSDEEPYQMDDVLDPEGSNSHKAEDDDIVRAADYRMGTDESKSHESDQEDGGSSGLRSSSESSSVEGSRPPVTDADSAYSDDNQSIDLMDEGVFEDADDGSQLDNRLQDGGNQNAENQSGKIVPDWGGHKSIGAANIFEEDASEVDLGWGAAGGLGDDSIQEFHMSPLKRSSIVGGMSHLSSVEEVKVNPLSDSEDSEPLEEGSPEQTDEVLEYDDESQPSFDDGEPYEFDQNEGNSQASSARSNSQSSDTNNVSAEDDNDESSLESSENDIKVYKGQYDETRLENNPSNSYHSSSGEVIEEEQHGMSEREEEAMAAYADRNTPSDSASEESGGLLSESHDGDLASSESQGGSASFPPNGSNPPSDGSQSSSSASANSVQSEDLRSESSERRQSSESEDIWDRSDSFRVDSNEGLHPGNDDEDHSSSYSASPEELDRSWSDAASLEDSNQSAYSENQLSHKGTLGTNVFTLSQEDNEAFSEDGESMDEKDMVFDESAERQSGDPLNSSSKLLQQAESMWGMAEYQSSDDGQSMEGGTRASFWDVVAEEEDSPDKASSPTATHDASQLQEAQSWEEEILEEDQSEEDNNSMIEEFLSDQESEVEEFSVDEELFDEKLLDDNAIIEHDKKMPTGEETEESKRASSDEVSINTDSNHTDPNLWASIPRMEDDSSSHFDGEGLAGDLLGVSPTQIKSILSIEAVKDADDADDLSYHQEVYKMPEKEEGRLVEEPMQEDAENDGEDSEDAGGECYACGLEMDIVPKEDIVFCQWCNKVCYCSGACLNWDWR